MDSISTVYDEVRSFVLESSESFIKRFCPDNRLPGATAGLRTYPATDSVLLQLFSALLKLGVREIAGMPISKRSIPYLASIKGDNYSTWWSLYVADLLSAAEAPFDSHPWLTDFSDAQRDELKKAMDSTKVVDIDGEKLIGKPNNYWIVMARLEKLRLKLGVISDDTIYRLALRKSREVFIGEKTGFMDDHHEGKGRFDMYTFDALHNAEPILPEIGGSEIDTALRAHEHLLRATAQPNGWYVCWGRSVERMSLMGMEFAAMLLKSRSTSEPELMLGLLSNSARRFMKEWWKDDTVAAHRKGMTHWYRGPQRLLEFSLDILVGMAGVVRHLGEVKGNDPDLTAETNPARLFPDQSTWIDFRENGPAVWCRRGDGLNFMLPLVEGYNSDYVAAPLAPGFLEQPIDNEFACGVPNLYYDKKVFLPLHLPANIRHDNNSASWETDTFTWYEGHDWWRPREDVGGIRKVRLTVDGAVLRFEEEWEIENVPDALSIFFAETRTPLSIEWFCEQPSRATTIVIEGMQHWRSYWHHHRLVHQLDIEPTNRVRLKYTISPEQKR